MAAANVSELIATLIDDVTGPSRAAGMAIKGLTEDIRKSTLTFESLGRQATKNFESAKTSLVGSVIAAGAFAAAMYEPIKKGMEFSETLKHLEIATGSTGAQMEELSKTFESVARDVHKTTQQVATAAAELPRTIQKSAEQTGVALKAAGRYADAWGADYASTVRLVTPMTQNFGIAIGDIGRNFDTMSAAQKIANISSSVLAENFASLTTEAKSLGYIGSSGLSAVLATVVAIASKTGDANKAFAEFHKIAEKISSPEFAETYRKMSGHDIYRRGARQRRRSDPRSR